MPKAAMMPIRKFTTATTAFTLMSVSACQSTRRPVTSHVRLRLASASTTVAMRVLLPLLDDDLADHQVVVDPAELVAHDAELARLVGNDLQSVVVAGHDLEVQVHRKEVESVIDVGGREMKRVLRAGPELEDGIPAPHPGEQIHLAARGRRDDGHAVVLTDLVFLDEP